VTIFNVFGFQTFEYAEVFNYRNKTPVNVNTSYVQSINIY